MDRYQQRIRFKRGEPVYPDGKNRNAARIAKLAKRLVRDLQDLGAYVYHTGIYGSTYIKFTHTRASDHCASQTILAGPITHTAGTWTCRSMRPTKTSISARPGTTSRCMAVTHS